jgi:hypothetical protein
MLYVAKSDAVALLRPSLPLSLAEKSSVFKLHGGNKHPVVTWKAIFDLVETNAAAKNLESPYATEQDSKDLVEESLRLTNPTPKRVRLMKTVDWDRESEVDLLTCVRASKEAFQKTEAELSELNTSLTLVASLTGRPKRAVNDGSAWAAIERIDHSVDEIDDGFTKVRGTLDSHAVDLEAALARAVAAHTTSNRVVWYV